MHQRHCNPGCSSRTHHSGDMPDMSDFGAAMSGESTGRTIFMMGDVTTSLVRDVISSIFRLAEENAVRPINLVISTEGGDVYDALSVYDAIKMSPAPVRTVGLGKVMSAGCLLLAAGEKGTRKMGRNAMLMYHAGWTLVGGDVFNQETELAEFKRQERQYDQLCAIETGRTLKSVEKLYLPKRVNNYMTAEQAMEFGFVDALV